MKNNINQYQFAVTCKRKYSYRNDEHFWEIELIDPQDGKLRKTYIGEDNFNADRWMQVIELLQRREGNAVCIFAEDFRTKRGKPDIINADSQIEYEGCYNLQDFLNQIVDMHYPEFV